MREWTRLDPSAVTPYLSSGATLELPRTYWPPWAQRSERVRRMWAYRLSPGEQVPSSAITREVIGRLLTERRDDADALPWNYNYYALAEDAQGGMWQSSPSRAVDFGHHLSDPVPPAALGARSSTSGEPR